VGAAREQGGAVPDLAGEWQRFCARLAALGEHLGTGDFPTDPTGRAAGIRHLGRQVVLALQGEIEHADPAHPSFHRYEEPWAQWGGPNPDNVYQRAPIDPGATYRVWGDVRGLRQAIFSLVDGDMHEGRFGVFSERTLDQLEIGPGGALEIWVAPTEQPGNWMPSHPDARRLLIRQYQCDFERDAIATLHIERPDTRGLPPAPPTPAGLAAALDRCAAWVEASIDSWQAYAANARDRLPHNSFGPPRTPPGGAPSIAYGSGIWDLGPDDALVATFPAPDADYWSWALHTMHWLDSGDFDARSTSINLTQAHVDADGQVRIVVAGRDPGSANWIDTAGQPVGMLVYRYVGARTTPEPAGRVVPIAAVREALPAEHPVVTPAARREALARRRAAVLARY
jgi:hypothetical protein